MSVAGTDVLYRTQSMMLTKVFPANKDERYDQGFVYQNLVSWPNPVSSGNNVIPFLTLRTKS